MVIVQLQVHYKGDGIPEVNVNVDDPLQVQVTVQSADQPRSVVTGNHDQSDGASSSHSIDACTSTANDDTDDTDHDQAEEHAEDDSS